MRISPEISKSSTLPLSAAQAVPGTASPLHQGKTAPRGINIAARKNALPALLLALAGLLFISALQSLTWLAGVDMLLIIAALSMLRLKPTVLASFLLRALPFTLVILAPLPFFVPGVPAASFSTPWGILVCSQEGLLQAATVGLRFTGAATIISALCSHFHWRDITAALTRLGIPPIIASIIQFALRYASLISEETQRMLRAQRNRGFVPGKNLWHLPTFKALGNALGYLFIRTFNRAERIYLCMAARGYLWEQQANSAIAKKQAAEQPSPQQPATASKAAFFPYIFQIKELSYTYPDGTRALQNINLSLPRGKKIAILGANGAGKSTLLLHLNATFLPQSGEIWLDGELLTPQNEFLAKQKVGMVFQDPDDQVFCSTVGEDIAFGPQNLRLPPAEIIRRVEKSLSQTGLTGLEHRAPHQLSYGQKKRAAIAGVLAMAPLVLVLDEPTASLDPQGQEEILAILEELHREGHTIIIATHDIDLTASWADMVVILKEGQVLAAGAPDLLADPELMHQAGLRLPLITQFFATAFPSPPRPLPTCITTGAAFLKERVLTSLQAKSRGR